MGTSASVVNPRNISSSNNIPEMNIGHSDSTIPVVSENVESMLGPNQLKSDWMNVDNLLHLLERGDLVEIRRGAYTHWVVYIGLQTDVPYVIHISNDSEMSEANLTKKQFFKKLLKSSKAIVRADPLSGAVGTSLCRINNSLDAQRRPFPPTIIVERALLKLGAGGYNLISNNCEHFSKWCRYSLRESNQSIFGQAGMLGLASTVITASACNGLVVGTAGFALMKVGQALRRRCFIRSIL